MLLDAGHHQTVLGGCLFWNWGSEAKKSSSHNQQAVIGILFAPLGLFMEGAALLFKNLLPLIIFMLCEKSFLAVGGHRCARKSSTGGTIMGTRGLSVPKNGHYIPRNKGVSSCVWFDRPRVLGVHRIATLVPGVDTTEPSALCMWY